MDLLFLQMVQKNILRFYTTGSGAGHIAFRGGVSGDAEGDNSGMFIDDTNNYVYVHAQSDINLT